MIPAEIKFRHVTLQVLFAHMVKCTDQAALQQAKARLCSIRVDISDDVFATTVAGDAMRSKLTADQRIARVFVGHQVRRLAHVGL